MLIESLRYPDGAGDGSENIVYKVNSFKHHRHSSNSLNLSTIVDDQMKNDPRSYDRNFYNCVKKPEKNSGLQRGLNP